MRLKERVAIVTGGASGIGASVCERFVAEGATVIVVDRDGEGAAKRAANLARAEACAWTSHISSVAGVIGIAGLPRYSASKAAINGLTQSVAKEVADRGVRVNAIAPGGTRTAMMGRAPTGMAPAVPIGRVAEPKRWHW